MTVLNKPDGYILAIVEVDRAQTKTIYLKKPFCECRDECELQYCGVDWQLGGFIALMKVNMRKCGENVSWY